VLGEAVGWFIGWDLLLEYTAIVAVVAIGVSQYVGYLVNSFGADLPAWMLGRRASAGDTRSTCSRSCCAWGSRCC